MIYVSSTPSQPKDPNSTHKKPINTSQSESFGASHLKLVRYLKSSWGSSKFFSGKPKEVRVGRSLRRRRKTKFWCLSLFLVLDWEIEVFQVLLMSEASTQSKLLEERSKIWEVDLVWRKGLVLVQGEESQRILLKEEFLDWVFRSRGVFPWLLAYIWCP